MGLLEDLIEEILKRLAVEDLIRYKIVCKSWYSLISNHRFVKAHLKQQKNNSSDNNNDLGHVRIAMPTYWKVPNERSFQYNSWRVVGSSNGLVCFTPLPLGALILLNNPLTREVRKLPFVMPENTSKEEICLGFGYDSSTDDYKLVLGISKLYTKETLIQVLSLKSNTWKHIGVVKYRIYRNMPGILFDGALHWITIDHNDNEEKTVILSFDLSQEEFTVISEPSDSKYECCLYDNQYTHLGIVEDQLCIYFYNRDDETPSNIWVMRSSKGERFWELFPDNYQMKYEVVHHMKILEFTSSYKNRMSFFCDDNKCLTRAPKHINAHRFVPSLVSPYAARPSHAKKYKTSFKSWRLTLNKGVEKKGQPLQATIRKFIIKGASEQQIREIEAVYRREVGEAENFYFQEEGNKEIEEIFTKIEGVTLCAERGRGCEE